MIDEHHHHIPTTNTSTHNHNHDELLRFTHALDSAAFFVAALLAAASATAVVRVQPQPQPQSALLLLASFVVAERRWPLHGVPAGTATAAATRTTLLLRQQRYIYSGNHVAIVRHSHTNGRTHATRRRWRRYYRLAVVSAAARLAVDAATIAVGSAHGVQCRGAESDGAVAARAGARRQPQQSSPS